MSTRWSETAVLKANLRLQQQIQRPLKQSRTFEIPDGRRRKYRNQPIEWHGLKFDSLLELEKYQELKLQEAAGAIRCVIRQVSLPLPGTTRRIRIDFLVITNEGIYRWADAKGMITKEWALKSKQILDAYGIQIELLKR